MKLAENNPGAISVLLQFAKETPRIDPDAAFGHISHLLNMDTYGIYGARIWMLYKDVCKQDITSMITALRSVQLGFIMIEELDCAIDNRGELNIQHLISEVRKICPMFASEVHLSAQENEQSDDTL
jgi:hypothetical protein